mmetsp:Transcript_55442/g.125990  ORF Transcript_55442/g.125990 Transcript_55442/m.125990 type:complete len:127 (-) Transcript_55442:184-564(-)
MEEAAVGQRARRAPRREDDEATFAQRAAALVPSEEEMQGTFKNMSDLNGAPEEGLCFAKAHSSDFRGWPSATEVHGFDYTGEACAWIPAAWWGSYLDEYLQVNYFDFNDHLRVECLEENSLVYSNV